MELKLNTNVLTLGLMMAWAGLTHCAPTAPPTVLTRTRNNPCGLPDGGTQTVWIPGLLPKLLTGANELNDKANSVQEVHFHDLDDHIRAYLDALNSFMDKTKINPADMTLHENAKANPDEELERHYDMLYEHADYLEKLFEYYNHDSAMRSSTEDLKNQVYKLICDVKSGMNGDNIDPPAEKLHQDFQDVMSGSDDGSKRFATYVVFGDTIEVSSFIKSIYESLEE